jgi:hypothetical protein
MPKTDYKTIDEYHAAYSGESLERMQQIRDIVHNIVPEVEEAISYQIPCFKYQGYLIYYCAFPKHLTISHVWSGALLAHFTTTGFVRSVRFNPFVPCLILNQLFLGFIRSRTLALDQHATKLLASCEARSLADLVRKIHFLLPVLVFAKAI